ncbi:MAG: DUF1573 domain-containing protein [Saprospiraceae bacterium]|nr:DUF1573 domain-containing protein [Saprospiraceae bacterium]MDW8230962.1 DUF1573 domain-containing protein [Saprospiraceae bacterium]
MRFTALLPALLLTLWATTTLVAQSISPMEIGDPTLNAGKVKWIPMQIETGEVPFGIPVERTIEAKNISQEDLVLIEVSSGCHCAVTEWTKEPIPPGQSGFIRVVYDAQREGEFYKVIAIRTNFDPDTQLGLGMVGRVLPRKE